MSRVPPAHDLECRMCARPSPASLCSRCTARLQALYGSTALSAADVALAPERWEARTRLVRARKPVIGWLDCEPPRLTVAGPEVSPMCRWPDCQRRNLPGRACCPAHKTRLSVLYGSTSVSDLDLILAPVRWSSRAGLPRAARPITGWVSASVDTYAGLMQRIRALEAENLSLRAWVEDATADLDYGSSGPSGDGDTPAG